MKVKKLICKLRKDPNLKKPEDLILKPILKNYTSKPENNSLENLPGEGVIVAGIFENIYDEKLKVGLVPEEIMTLDK